jgi:hypothetical protein
MNSKAHETLASPRQVRYIDDLFNHLGFEPSAKRKFLEDGYGKKYPDELTTEQASAVIGYLQARWDQEKIDRKGKLKL